ncbi:hypothetical protein P0Y35_06060 [Kiritimatiellaeota bacterium B1221]|nr:hypothetical protein [Kiritimatiellaeota bacterium B1221]
MTRSLIICTTLTCSLFLLTHCGQAPNPAEVEHQEVSMAKHAEEQLSEFDYQLSQHDGLPSKVLEAWDHAKTEYLRAAETLLHAESAEMDEALAAYNTAWNHVLSSYQSAKKHF